VLKLQERFREIPHLEPEDFSMREQVKKLFLIDAHSQIYMAYYALPPMTNSRGVPTNAVYGFTSTLLKILRKEKPDYLLAAFDSKGPTFRHKKFEEYKATRKPMPEELEPQIPIILEILDAMKIETFALPGYEADDLIATIARKAEQAGIEAYIVTRDKDADQLLSDHIKVYDSKRETVRTRETLQEEKGIRPEQVPDMMGLAGDTSDNIPGVPGIGPKTALKLILEFGSLENVLANIEKIKGEKLRENLRAYADQARLSRELARLKTDLPVKVDFRKFETKGFDGERLKQLFEELDFKRFSEELLELRTTDKRNYHLVNTEAEFQAFIQALVKQKRFSFDIETTSPFPVEAEPVGFSFSFEEGKAYYIPVAGPPGEKVLSIADVVRALKPILEDPSIEKVGQNLKYDATVLRNLGVRLQGIGFDTMIASYLLDPGKRRHNLSDLSMRYLSIRTTPISDLIGKGKKQRSMKEVPVSIVADYASADADLALRLSNILGPKLVQADLERLFREVELPLILVLSEMEHTGICVQAEVLEELSRELAGRLEELEKKIYEQAGTRFNISSPKQLAEVLFEKLKLPSLKSTKTGFSTDASVLEDLSREHILARLLLEYRQLAKLKSTYADALPRMISKKTGRIHASFNQTVTATGRLSSSDPNLQNIPMRTELGRRIRKAFVASDGESRILSADYSQIELRILAHFSGDPALRKAFAEGRDIHAFVASEIFGKRLDEVTAEMRRKAKAVNFGVIYGLSPYGLAKQVDISVEEAKAFIDEYFARYSTVEKYLSSILKEAKEKGYVSTILNRRRYISGIENTEGRNRNFAERTAINTVIQGSAADMIKVAMNNIYRRIVKEKRPSKLLIQIHDELVFETPARALEGESAMIVQEMANAIPLKVPVKVNAASGVNWMEV